MATLNLPEKPGELVIAADGDPNGRKSALSLAQRATGLGWKVSTVDPGDGLDFNDILMSAANNV
ncbi:toprim domain-containing protein [Aliiruegeria lutimaris]|uniref:toprim domain-containing protein n=1 Tax=Aliiruegeria lutimaris TaxID=571298 RepID=UPI000B8212C2|nr:toprim domain-containing protein [Aliiruegeria lutimaris]